MHFVFISQTWGQLTQLLSEEAPQSSRVWLSKSCKCMAHLLSALNRFLAFSKASFLIKGH